MSKPLTPIPEAPRRRLPRLRDVAILGGVAALAAAFAVWGASRRRPASIVDVLPKNVAIVVDVDLVALRASARGRALLEGVFGKALDARSQCARALLDRVDRIGLAVDAAGDSIDDVAIVALASSVKAREVIDCATKVIADRGGAPNAWSGSKIGTFATVTDGDGSKGVLAVRDGGPIIVGHGAFLEGVLGAADGTTPTLRDDPSHDLPRRDGKGAVATITYALPDTMRADLATKLPKGARVVTEVGSAIATLFFDDGGARLHLDAACAKDACTELAAWLDGARQLVAHDPRTTILDLRSAVDAAKIAATTGHVTIDVTVSGAQLDEAWRRMESPPATSALLPPSHPSTAASAP